MDVDNPVAGQFGLSMPSSGSSGVKGLHVDTIWTRCHLLTCPESALPSEGSEEEEAVVET